MGGPSSLSRSGGVVPGTGCMVPQPFFRWEEPIVSRLLGCKRWPVVSGVQDPDRSATCFWWHQKVLVFAGGNESTYGWDPISTIHCYRGCRNWGCFDASDRWQCAHHYVLKSVPHRHWNKVFIHWKVMFILILCLLQIITLLAIQYLYSCMWGRCN
jgi:hypothetical protein